MKDLFNKIFDSEKLLSSILIAVVPSLLFYGFSIYIFTSNGFETAEIIRDSARLREESSFLGFLSNIGVWMWVSTAAICFFSLFSRDFKEQKNLRELIFLTGLLSIILAVDDFFMLHDRFISQKICFPFYAIYATTLMIRHFKKIVEIDAIAFLLGCSFLALSIFIDLVQHMITFAFPFSYIQVIEEGFKFTGAATWLYFNFRIASYRPILSMAASR